MQEVSNPDPQDPWQSPGFAVGRDEPVFEDAFDQMHVELEALQEVGHQTTWNRTNNCHQTQPLQPNHRMMSGLYISILRYNCL